MSVDKKSVKVISNHASLDVVRGQKKMQKHLEKGGVCHVKIGGTIKPDFRAHNDDGVSVEFTFNPYNVEVFLEDGEQ